MKNLVILTLAALAAAASTQTSVSPAEASKAAAAKEQLVELQKQLPKCSLACIMQTAKDFGCEVTDVTCQCQNLEALTQEVSPCLVNKGKCSLQEVTDTATSVARICKENAKSKNGANVTDAANELLTAAASPSESAQPTDAPDAASRLQYTGAIGIAMGVVAVVML